MAERINATCSICGNGYYKCLSCRDLMKLNPWKEHTDTSEHYKIYQVIHGFSTKVYNKEEAKSKLEKIDLSDFDNFRDNIKEIIKNIMSEDKKIQDVIVDESNDFLESEISTDAQKDIIVKETKIVPKRKSLKTVETE